MHFTGPRRASSSKRPIAIRGIGPCAGLFLALAGCAGPAPLTNATGTSMVSSETAFAYPAPGGPAVTAVLEQRFANATQQDILLSTSARTPGQNMLRVQMFGPVDAAQAGETRLRDGYLPIGDVGSEMRRLLPGIRMQRSPFYVQNKYGPFGYAVGRGSSGDTCLYGWQRIASTGSTQTLIGNKGSIQVRLRLCDQDGSERHLLDVMYGYTISSAFRTRNWNPYGEAPAPGEAIGKAGHPLYPVGAAEVAAPAPVRPVRRSASPRAAIEQAPAVPQTLQPIGPMVPPPPGGKTIGTQPPKAALPAADAGASAAAQPVVPPPPCTAAGGCNQSREETTR